MDLAKVTCENGDADIQVLEVSKPRCPWSRCKQWLPSTWVEKSARVPALVRLILETISDCPANPEHTSGVRPPVS